MSEQGRVGAQEGSSASGPRTTNGVYLHPLNYPMQATNVNYGVNYGTVNQIAYHDSGASTGPLSLLMPIPDASHTRNRRTSPPDSSCLPGTRRNVLEKIRSWALDDSFDAALAAVDDISGISGPIPTDKHVIWLCGPVGCGKSAISQAVAEEFEERGLLLGSFFFFRGSGDRSRIARFIVTLACQMADSIPETRPLVEAALKKSFGLQAASPRVQFHRLVCQPLQAVLADLAAGTPSDGRPSLALKGPFLGIIDGVDECNDREEVAALINGILDFFERNPHFPLRFLVASRVEEHIRARIQRPGGSVHIENIQDYDSRDDIMTLVKHTFEEAATSNLVIRSYGNWPSNWQIEELVDHAGGSFIFVATLLQYILSSKVPLHDGMTPMERFEVALTMNPGLDGLYMEVLQRAMHVPHFSVVVLTIAALYKPVSISDLSSILDIPTYTIVNVLIPLQSIIRVPGDDETPVTIFHTSFVDFVKDVNRSKSLFSSHERDSVPKKLAYGCSLIRLNDCFGCDAHTRVQKGALDYASRYLAKHWGSLPPPESLHLEFAASIVGNKAASNSHLQILYSAFTCTVDSNRQTKDTLSYFAYLPSPDDYFAAALKFWKLLAHWVQNNGPMAMDYLQATYKTPLPKPDPLLHRCIIMHFMRCLFCTNSGNSIYSFGYIIRNFTHHLRLAVISTGEDGDDEGVLAFLKVPYVVTPARLPVDKNYIRAGDTLDTWSLISDISAKFSDRVDPHPWKNYSLNENVLPNNPTAVWVHLDKPGFSVLDVLHVLHQVDAMHPPVRYSSEPQVRVTLRDGVELECGRMSGWKLQSPDHKAPPRGPPILSAADSYSL